MCRDIVGFASDYINIDAQQGCANSYQDICKKVCIAFSAHKKKIVERDVREKIKETSKFFNYINCNYSKHFLIKSAPKFCSINKII